MCMQQILEVGDLMRKCLLCARAYLPMLVLFKFTLMWVWMCLCAHTCLCLCKSVYMPEQSPHKYKQGSHYRRFVPLRPRAYERLSSRSSAHIGGQGIKELSTQTKLAKSSLRRRANNIILRTLLDSITLDETIWPFDANPFWIWNNYVTKGRCS